MECLWKIITWMVNILLEHNSMEHHDMEIQIPLEHHYMNGEIRLENDYMKYDYMDMDVPLGNHSLT